MFHVKHSPLLGFWMMVALTKKNEGAPKSRFSPGICRKTVLQDFPVQGEGDQTPAAFSKMRRDCRAAPLRRGRSLRIGQKVWDKCAGSARPRLEEKFDREGFSG